LAFISLFDEFPMLIIHVVYDTYLLCIGISYTPIGHEEESPMHYICLPIGIRYICEDPLCESPT
jgi:hypothetical protein